MRDHDALVRFFAERADMPFVWGSAANDCVSFVGAAIAAQTGVNPFADLHWGDEVEGDALIEAVGGLETEVSRRLRRIVPAEAHRGDIAGVLSGNVLGLLIVDGPVLVGPGVKRMMRRRRRGMTMAWSAE